MPFHGDLNRQGTVRAKPVRDALCALLSRKANDPLDDEPKTLAQELALSLIRDATSEDVRIRMEARAEIIDRTEGKPKQALTGGDEEDKSLIPSRIEIVAIDAAGAT